MMAEPNNDQTNRTHADVLNFEAIHRGLPEHVRRLVTIEELRLWSTNEQVACGISFDDVIAEMELMQRGSDLKRNAG